MSLARLIAALRRVDPGAFVHDGPLEAKDFERAHALSERGRAGPEKLDEMLQQSPLYVVTVSCCGMKMTREKVDAHDVARCAMMGPRR